MGCGSCDLNLYCEVVDCICLVDVDVIINLMVGMGGDFEIGLGEDLMCFGKGIDLVGGFMCLVYVEELLFEICMFDCGMLNFGDGDYIYVLMFV